MGGTVIHPRSNNQQLKCKVKTGSSRAKCETICHTDRPPRFNVAGEILAGFSVRFPRAILGSWEAS